ncbi:MAG: flagellar brake protein [Pseudomonadota bacterium]
MSQAYSRLEDLQLMPGQVLNLEFFESLSQRERSVLLGYAPGHSIIATAPSANGMRLPIAIDELCNIRLFSSRLNGACAFTSRVIHTSSMPYPHIHFAIPKEISIGEVRKAIRTRVNLVGSIRSQDGKRETATIVDLSSDGARIQSRSALAEQGDEIVLSFKCLVAGIERIISAQSIVRSNQCDDGIYAFGLQFCDLDMDDQIALYAYVLSCLQNPQNIG